MSTLGWNVVCLERDLYDIYMTNRHWNARPRNLVRILQRHSNCEQGRLQDTSQALRHTMQERS